MVSSNLEQSNLSIKKIECLFLTEIIDSKHSSLKEVADGFISDMKRKITIEASKLVTDHKHLFLNEIVTELNKYQKRQDGFFDRSILGFFSYLIHNAIFKNTILRPFIADLKVFLPEIIEYIKHNKISLYITKDRFSNKTCSFFYFCSYIPSAAYRHNSYNDIIGLINGDLDCQNYFSRMFSLNLREEVSLLDLSSQIKICLVPEKQLNPNGFKQIFSNKLHDSEFNDLQRIWTDIVISLIEYSHSLTTNPNKTSYEDKKVLREKSKSVRHSYNWTTKDASIDDLYDKLINCNLIASETTKEDFIAVFSKTPLPEIKKPIQWEKGPKLFVYFFDKLTQEKFIANQPKWIILKYCFTYYRDKDESYSPMPENVKSNLTTINEIGVKGSDTIDRIFTEIQGKTVK